MNIEQQDELKGIYDTTADELAEAGYVAEAIEMLGKGYEPSIEIEAPQTVTQRRGGKLVETDRPAFVKIYTSFKGELKDIAGDDLKVWLYLALSVNRFSGDARPGLRKIAEDTDISVNTVRAILDRLQDRNLLEVRKADGKSNTYYPSDYVSARKETVSKFDTVPETVSNLSETVSKNAGTVSNQYRKTAQPEEPEEPERTRDVLDGIIHYQLKPQSIRKAIADFFKLTPNWEAKYNRQFLEWLVSVEATPEQVQTAAKKWGSDKRFNWTVPTLKGIQEHWLELIEGASGTFAHLDGSALERLEAQG